MQRSPWDHYTGGTALACQKSIVRDMALTNPQENSKVGHQEEPHARRGPRVWEISRTRDVPRCLILQTTLRWLGIARYHTRGGYLTSLESLAIESRLLVRCSLLYLVIILLAWNPCKEHVYFFHPPKEKSTGSVSKTSKATKLGENKFYTTTKDTSGCFTHQGRYDIAKSRKREIDFCSLL